MVQRDVPLTWLLVAIFGAGIALGAAVVLGALAMTSQEESSRVLPLEPMEQERQIVAPSQAEKRRRSDTEFASTKTSRTGQSGASANTSLGKESLEGESAAAILARFEAAYRAQLARWERRYSSEMLAHDPENGWGAWSEGDDERGAPFDEPPQRPQEERALTEDGLSDEDESPLVSPRDSESSGGSSSPEESQRPVVEITDRRITTSTTNQMVVVSAPTQVTTRVAPQQGDSAVVTSAPLGTQASGLSLPGGTFVGVIGPSFPANPSLETVRSPPTRASPRRRGAPPSAHDRSPWAPIDMSRHHNPWQSTRLP